MSPSYHTVLQSANLHFYDMITTFSRATGILSFYCSVFEKTQDRTYLILFAGLGNNIAVAHIVAVILIVESELYI